MNKGTITAALVGCGIVGWLVGMQVAVSTTPIQIVTVSEPSEMPSPSPIVVSPSPIVVVTTTQAPRPSAIYVPPRSADPDPANPSAGGNVGGGYASGQPRPTRSTR